MATRPEITISSPFTSVWGHMTNSPSGVCVISGLSGLSIQYAFPHLTSPFEVTSEVHVEHDGITIRKGSWFLSHTWKRCTQKSSSSKNIFIGLYVEGNKLLFNRPLRFCHCLRGQLMLHSLTSSVPRILPGNSWYSLITVGQMIKLMARDYII